MANQVLMTISRDERERERLMQEERILLDYYSGINYTKKKSLAEGIEIGTGIGEQIGEKRGIQIGTEKGIKIGTEKGIKIGTEKERKEILKLADQVSSLEDLEKFKQLLSGH